MKIRLLVLLVISWLGLNSPAAVFIGVGQSMYDVIFEMNDDDLSKIVLVAGGKMGECTPINSERALQIKDLLQSPIKEASGGSIANTIAWLSRSSKNNVTFFHTVANDDFGKRFLQHFNRLGINSVHHTVEDDTAVSGVVFTLIAPNGERTMFPVEGISAQLDVQKLGNEAIKASDFLVAESYSFMGSQAEHAVTESLKRATTLQVKTALTLAAPFIAEKYRTNILDILPHVTILFGNESEYFALFNTSDLERVIELVRDKVACAVITRGEEGVYVISKDETINVPVLEKIQNPVDTTGAGDGFAAGFLHSQALGLDFKKSAQLGNLVARHIIQKLGASPEPDENGALLEAFLENVRSFNN